MYILQLDFGYLFTLLNYFIEARWTNMEPIINSTL